jgi:hypothetical protein
VLRAVAALRCLLQTGLKRSALKVDAHAAECRAKLRKFVDDAVCASKARGTALQHAAPRGTRMY